MDFSHSFSYFSCEIISDYQLMSYSIFQSQYTWPEKLNDKVYNDWKKKASKRLRDMVFKAMKKKFVTG